MVFLTGQCVELGGCSGDVAATTATLVCGPYPATPNIEAARKKWYNIWLFSGLDPRPVVDRPQYLGGRVRKI